MSKYLKDRALGRPSAEDFLIHQSAYQLKEFDPQSWVIPRLEGKAKAAMIEVAFDEYGCGRAEHIHATLFRNSMEALGLDGRYGAYLDRIPGLNLAPVNLMTMFGLHRRLAGAAGRPSRHRRAHLLAVDQERRPTACGGSATAPMRRTSSTCTCSPTPSTT